MIIYHIINQNENVLRASTNESLSRIREESCKNSHTRCKTFHFIDDVWRAYIRWKIILQPQVHNGYIYWYDTSYILHYSGNQHPNQVLVNAPPLHRHQKVPET